MGTDQQEILEWMMKQGHLPQTNSPFYQEELQYQRDINRIKRDIAEILFGRGKDTLPSLLDELQGTDWNEWHEEVQRFRQGEVRNIRPCDQCSHNMPRTYDKKWPGQQVEVRVCEQCQQKFRELKAQDERTPRPCQICKGEHAPIDLVELEIRSKTIFQGKAKMQICPVFPDQAIDHLRETCQACDSRYIPTHSMILCNTCWEGPIRKEWEKVSNNKSRARSQGQAARLTIKQWLQTIDHFHQKCAYCQKRDYSDLEHYIPLPQAGTTVDNCLPSCGKCNNRKSNRSPDALVEIFPVENLERITAYFEAVRAS
jgi:hypothetical protein